MIGLGDISLSQYLIDECGFEMVETKGSKPKNYQEGGFMKLATGTIALSVIQHLVEQHYSELEYGLSGLKTYIGSFKITAESSFEKLLIECILNDSNEMELLITSVGATQ